MTDIVEALRALRREIELRFSGQFVENMACTLDASLAEIERLRALSAPRVDAARNRGFHEDHRGVSRRSSPSFAIGGVSWLDHRGLCYDIALPVEGRWRCFICNETFSSVDSALRHFGTDPRQQPRCTHDKTLSASAPSVDRNEVERLRDLELTEDGYSLRMPYDGDADDGRPIVVGGEIVATFVDSEEGETLRDFVLAALARPPQSGESK